MEIWKEIKFDEKGLVPVVIQDFRNNEVLMVAYMNEEALLKTLQSGRTHFWSRSRARLWQKGESSGHIQKVREVYLDCDADCLLIKVDQEVACCHTGYRSCFYRKLEDGRIVVFGEKVFEVEDDG